MVFFENMNEPNPLKAALTEFHTIVPSMRGEAREAMGAIGPKARFEVPKGKGQELHDLLAKHGHKPEITKAGGTDIVTVHNAPNGLRNAVRSLFPTKR